MSSFLTGVGSLGVIIGVVYLIICITKKKRKKVALFVIIGAFAINVIGVEIAPVDAESNNKQSESTKKNIEKDKLEKSKKSSKEKDIKISDASIITQVQFYIEKYDKIDNVKWSWNSDKYNITKMPAIKSTDDGKSFNDVYSAHGTYSWHDKKYYYTITVNFPNENSSQLISLKTDMGTNIERPAEEVK
ncbi:TPA: hypothetical protein LET21_002064 [Listeria monocytogenes]|nr:hypothetical protein [Listeria monocytogenes]EEO6529232.1 hypothetical protein [Listeria monocytogenes]HAC4759456.1 hypothetical protein [Listeria monocytogenes]HBK0037861.1 hypothetical protein [Listeria monocytogenes]